MTNLLLAILPVIFSAHAASLEETYAVASARAALSAPCPQVQEIRLDRPSLAQGDVTLGFSAATYQPGGGHAAWKVTLDAAVFGAKPGTMDGSVPKAQYRQLITTVNSAEFFALGSRYADGGRGGETVVLTVTCVDGRSKSVTVVGASAPKAFQSAAEAILKLAAALFWVS